MGGLVKFGLRGGGRVARQEGRRGRGGIGIDVVGCVDLSDTEGNVAGLEG